MDASAWIELLLKRSDELRKAGVLEIGADGCSATLAPAPPAEPTPGEKTTPERTYLDALSDPASYPDGTVPGFVIEPLED